MFENEIAKIEELNLNHATLYDVPVKIINLAPILFEIAFKDVNFFQQPVIMQIEGFEVEYNPENRITTDSIIEAPKKIASNWFIFGIEAIQSL